jgi:hypothetical protein
MEINLAWPHPMVIASCLAALGLGFIVRYFLEEYTGLDIEEQLRKLFGRR